MRRIRNAARLGIPFYRRAALRLPAQLRLGGRYVPIVYPPETGVRVDFVTCFVEDEYGLWHSGTREAGSVLDIGANMGFFSLAARARFPDAVIHAYEPNPRIAQFVTENGRHADIVVYREAVGSVAGFVRIDDATDSNQARTAPADAGVRQVSLAEAVARLGGRVDLAKVDCEGAEWDLFSDPAPWRCIRELRMEYHLWGKRDYAQVQAAMTQLDFAIHKHHPSGEWGTIWATNRGAP